MKSEVTEGLLTIAQFAEDSGLGAKGVKKIIAKSNCGVSKISGITFLNKTEIEQAFKTEIKNSKETRENNNEIRKERIEKEKISKLAFKEIIKEDIISLPLLETVLRSIVSGELKISHDEQGLINFEGPVFLSLPEKKSKK